MKKPVILLHGALGSQTQFDPLKVLLHETFDILVFDFSGHGLSKPSTSIFSIETFSAELDYFIQQQHLNSVNILGYSMGGYAALYLASQKPDLIEKIITLGTKFDWSPESAAKEIKFLDVEKIKLKVPDYAEELKNRHSAFGWENVLKSTSQMMISLGNNPLLNERTLAEISTSVLICRGDSDLMISRDESEFASKLIPNARFLELIETSHPIEKVNLSLLSQTIFEFFT